MQKIKIKEEEIDFSNPHLYKKNKSLGCQKDYLIQI